MGFRLGSERGNYMVSGEIKSKLSFDKEGGDTALSVPGPPIIRNTQIEIDTDKRGIIFIVRIKMTFIK